MQARDDGWYRRIAFGLLGFAISVAVVEPILVSIHLEHFERRFGWVDDTMADASLYYGAQREVAGSTGLVQFVMSKRLENLQKELASLAKRRTIRIAGEEVTNTWRDMILHAEHCVCATNVVAKKEWSEVGGDDGIAPQVDAMKQRQVTIVRVFLPDESKRDHTLQLRALAGVQRAAHIPVYELAMSRVVSNPSYDKYRQELNAIDVVVVDNSLALLTQTDPLTHQATGATLSSDPETVAEAKEYVLRVLADVQASVPRRCK
jgi:hypothetical protein